MNTTMQILIVDDSRVIRAMLRALLQTVGYTNIDVADGAASAFARLGLNTTATGPAVDLILMDLTMAEMDGITAIGHIQERPALRDIPIIVVTGRDEAADLQGAFEAGAIDYITKPVNEVELLVRVGSALRLKNEMDQRKARERELEETARRLEAANAQLQLLSAIDGLTGVANRRQFDTTLAAEWGRAKREGSSLALLMIDVDYFKLFNDTYGHPHGDTCLKAVADCLTKSVFRQGDLVARYGGEEFAIILPTSDLGGALAVATRAQAEVERLAMPHKGSKVSDRVTLSIGVTAMLPGSDTLPENLITAADKALYQAKQGGRNRVVAV